MSDSKNDDNLNSSDVKKIVTEGLGSSDFSEEIAAQQQKLASLETEIRFLTDQKYIIKKQVDAIKNIKLSEIKNKSAIDFLKIDIETLEKKIDNELNKLGNPDLVVSVGGPPPPPSIPGGGLKFAIKTGPAVNLASAIGGVNLKKDINADEGLTAKTNYVDEIKDGMQLKRTNNVKNEETPTQYLQRLQKNISIKEDTYRTLFNEVKNLTIELATENASLPQYQQIVATQQRLIETLTSQKETLTEKLQTIKDKVEIELAKYETAAPTLNSDAQHITEPESDKLEIVEPETAEPEIANLATDIPAPPGPLPPPPPPAFNLQPKNLNTIKKTTGKTIETIKSFSPEDIAKPALERQARSEQLMINNLLLNKLIEIIKINDNAEINDESPEYSAYDQKLLDSLDPDLFDDLSDIIKQHQDAAVSNNLDNLFRSALASRRGGVSGKRQNLSSYLSQNSTNSELQSLLNTRIQAEDLTNAKPIVLEIYKSELAEKENAAKAEALAKQELENAQKRAAEQEAITAAKEKAVKNASRLAEIGITSEIDDEKVNATIVSTNKTINELNKIKTETTDNFLAQLDNRVDSYINAYNVRKENESPAPIVSVPPAGTNVPAVTEITTNDENITNLIAEQTTQKLATDKTIKQETELEVVSADNKDSEMIIEVELEPKEDRIDSKLEDESRLEIDLDDIDEPEIFIITEPEFNEVKAGSKLEDETKLEIDLDDIDEPEISIVTEPGPNEIETGIKLDSKSSFNNNDSIEVEEIPIHKLSPSKLAAENKAFLKEIKFDDFVKRLTSRLSKMQGRDKNAADKLQTNINALNKYKIEFTSGQDTIEGFKKKCKDLITHKSNKSLADPRTAIGKFLNKCFGILSETGIILNEFKSSILNLKGELDHKENNKDEHNNFRMK